jgi:TonB family protein
MKGLKIIIVAAGWVACACAAALAGEVKIIANREIKVDSISTGDLKSLFLEEKMSLADGTHVELVINRSGVANEKFLQQYVGKSLDDLRTYYRSLVFSGRASMPKEFGSDAEVVAYVAKTRGAIGYVAADSSTEGVKTLTVGAAANSSERKLLTRVEPLYPETLQRLSIGGIVRLKVTISRKGTVDDVQLLGGNPILAEAATTAVKQWIYSPGLSKTILEVTIPFEPHH